MGSGEGDYGVIRPSTASYGVNVKLQKVFDSLSKAWFMCITPRLRDSVQTGCLTHYCQLQCPRCPDRATLPMFASQGQ